MFMLHVQRVIYYGNTHLQWRFDHIASHDMYAYFNMNINTTWQVSLVKDLEWDNSEWKWEISYIIEGGGLCDFTTK